MYVTGQPEVRIEAIFKETMAEDFPILMKDINPQIQESQQTEAG